MSEEGNDSHDISEAKKHSHIKIVTKDFFLESINLNSIRLEEHFLIGVKKSNASHVSQKPSSSSKSDNRLIPDKLCTENVTVYESNGTLWRCTLNQTNIGKSQKGSNKFYIIELLVSPKKEYYVYTRHGRVGYDGIKKLDKRPSLDNAKQVFETKFLQKTKNSWDERDNFVVHPNKYTLIDLCYDDDDDGEEEVENPINKNEVKSSLDIRLQDLIKLIFDNTMMKDTVTKMNYDIKKQPLGKLSKDTIKKALEVLKEIEDVLKNNPNDKHRLDDLSNRFYTTIPHNFGLNRPPSINNLVILEEKVDLLDALNQIDNANTLMKQDTQFGDITINPLDRKYKQLGLEMKVVEKNDEIWNVLSKYIHNTHAPTHTNYTLTLLDAFEVIRDSERQSFVAHDNQMLLFHGSRLSNYVGILSKGLRIAPPEAPSTGYMFGKGIYFADLSSKSANYCIAGGNDNIGLLLVCQVSLGEMMEKTSAFYVKKLPPKYQSVKGVGKTHPDPKDAHDLDDVVVPYGKPVLNPDVSKTDLLYNEYIVYNTNQVMFKYLLKVRFNYK